MFWSHDFLKYNVLLYVTSSHMSPYVTFNFRQYKYKIGSSQLGDKFGSKFNSGLSSDTNNVGGAVCCRKAVPDLTYWIDKLTNWQTHWVTLVDSNWPPSPWTPPSSDVPGSAWSPRPGQAKPGPGLSSLFFFCRENQNNLPEIKPCPHANSLAFYT